MNNQNSELENQEDSQNSRNIFFNRVSDGHDHQWHNSLFCYVCGIHKIQLYEGEIEKQLEKDILYYYSLDTPLLEKQIQDIIETTKKTKYVSVYKTQFASRNEIDYVFALTINISIDIPKVRKGKAIIYDQFGQIDTLIKDTVKVSNFNIHTLKFYDTKSVTLEYQRFIRVPLNIVQFLGVETN